MDRPKIEITSIELDMFLSSTNPIAIYIEKLNKYIDQLEKAIDKACEELEKWDINNFDNTTVTKEKWKKELMKDEED